VGGYFKDPAGTAKLVGSDMRGAGENNFVLSKDNMMELKEHLQKAIREIPQFDKLQNHIDMTVTNEGLRIELTESALGTFFDSGSALVTLLANRLGKLPNHIAIEGHTDSKPYPPAATYTNWELSADRANAARRLMQMNGIRADQITQVRGFADQRLRKPDAPLDPVNWRISLIVQYIEKPADASAASAQEGGSQSTGEKKKLARARDRRKLRARKARLNREIGPKLALFSLCKKSRGSALKHLLLMH
jgi:chemotaxis protein MotB